MIGVRFDSKLMAVLIAVSAMFMDAANSAPADLAPQSVSAQTSNGQVICNEGGALSQVPSHPDFFVGRGMGIGTLDYCHTGIRHPTPFLALFKMDWRRHALVMQNYLLKPPAKTPLGVIIRGAYDPYVVNYKGELWVAFECLVPGVVSACVAPLTPDLKRLDLSRLTVPAIGKEGPFQNHPLVTLISASAPVLLNYKEKLYLYWQICPFANLAPENLMPTRGMQLEEDAKGRMWGVGSGGKSVTTDDPRLTTIVHDVIPDDKTANHVAATWSLIPVGDEILEISSIGGTDGAQVCASPHNAGAGCWRLSLSEADAPLGANVFGQHVLRASTSMPGNTFSYAHVFTDPTGKHFLMSWLEPPKSSPSPDRAAPLKARGIVYFPFEPAELVQPSIGK